MCMEDVKIGINSQWAEDLYTVGAATPVLILPAKNDRLAVYFPSDSGVTWEFSHLRLFTAGQGIKVCSNTDGILLTLQQHGALVKGPYWALSTGGAVFLRIMQVFLGDREGDR